MKFAKELEDDLVPEWRVKYLNYKAGKKKIKAVGKAFRNANSPKTPGRPKSTQADRTPRSHLPYTHYDFAQRGTKPDTGDSAQKLFQQETGNGTPSSRPDPTRRESMTMFANSPPLAAHSPPSASEESSERKPLNIPARARHPDDPSYNYGSIVGTPPYNRSRRHMPSLELPDPAIGHTSRGEIPTTADSNAKSPRAPPIPTESPDAYHIGRDTGLPRQASTLPRKLFKNNRTSSMPPGKNTFPRSQIKRMFSARRIDSPGSDVKLGSYRDLDEKQDDFFRFLDKELDKIETFYKMKEDEATERLHALREQLHELRDQRIADIHAAKHGNEVREDGLLRSFMPDLPLPTMPFKDEGAANGSGHSLLKPIENAMKRKAHIGKTSEAMENLASPTHPQPKRNENKSDYTRRTHTNEHVTYRFAKRRLKLALQEFYRGLELLKSYALLNRTGFRKINKKYDKAVNARPTQRYMTEKVNKAYFVQSNVIEGHIVTVEDFYARYFERGNHKIAVGKLRTKLRSADQSPTSFRNGLFVAAGVICAIQGLIGAAQHIGSSNSTISVQASYLLQLYAGYFLIDILFLMFVLNCKIWTAARINYVFVFEYDTRHVLDWRQLAELPCFFLFLNGLFLWLNFRSDVTASMHDTMYLYYPLWLIGITLVVMCMPLPILYHNARKWWGFSNWRLLLAGLYPVEFRDFYLGDMYCSETYAMSQVALFFCLYAHNWTDPPQCNSNHSRLLGFFTTLPAIWRALQCLRRYYDSRNWFPHLANFLKYCGNILYYMSLSMYRIRINTQMHAIFIVFAAINAIYCSFWDVAMDFSLGNPWAKHPFLRDHLGYRRVWVYYFAAIADIILRQQWIFYAIFSHELQHSAFLSFAVGLAEVLRRGMWSLFRVENEHCNNVGKFRASRDIPLPYNLPANADIPPKNSPKGKGSPGKQGDHGKDDAAATGLDLERANTQATGSSLRQRLSGTAEEPAKSSPGLRTLQRVGTVIASAHAHDFTKKVKPGDALGSSPRSQLLSHSGNDSSDETDGDMDSEDAELEREEMGTEQMSDQLGQDEEEVMEAQRLISHGHDA